MLSNLQRRTFATNLNDIQKQIKGTQAIRKITKSMKMVSAAKLKGDETRMKKGITFGRGFLHLLPEKRYTSETEPQPAPTSNNALVAVISSDKGLCGGINSFATKMARTVHDALQKQTGNPSPLVVFGGKSEGQLKRTHGDYLLAVVDECWKNPMNFAVASGMATQLLKASAQSDQINIVYNSYVSKIKYDTTVQRIPNFEQVFAASDNLPAPLDAYELEPEGADFVQNFNEFALATTLYGICLDNATAEQSARMQAMDNATKNAGEMIDRLLLIYNRARQAKITTELIEIISGAESLKG